MLSSYVNGKRILDHISNMLPSIDKKNPVSNAFVNIIKSEFKLKNDEFASEIASFIIHSIVNAEPTPITNRINFMKKMRKMKDDILTKYKSVLDQKVVVQSLNDATIIIMNYWEIVIKKEKQKELLVIEQAENGNDILDYFSKVPKHYESNGIYKVSVNIIRRQFDLENNDDFAREITSFIIDSIYNNEFNPKTDRRSFLNKIQEEYDGIIVKYNNSDLDQKVIINCLNKAVDIIMEFWTKIVN